MNDSLLARIANDVRRMDDDFSFHNAISNNITYSKDDGIYYFVLLWKCIPDKYLYRTYVDTLTDIECGHLYNHFFKDDLLAKLKTLNHSEVQENPELLKFADKDGWVTVYHGHCKPTLRNSNSWTVYSDIAKWFGQRNALFNQSADYYVAKGRVKLSDIIAYTNSRGEFEVVVPAKYVKNRTKKFYSSADDVPHPEVMLESIAQHNKKWCEENGHSYELIFGNHTA